MIRMGQVRSLARRVTSGCNSPEAAGSVHAAPSALFEGADLTRFDAPQPVAFDAPESAAAFAAVSEFLSAIAPGQSSR
jgi:hypothetical protein